MLTLLMFGFLPVWGVPKGTFLQDADGPLGPMHVPGLTHRLLTFQAVALGQLPSAQANNCCCHSRHDMSALPNGVAVSLQLPGFHPGLLIRMYSRTWGFYTTPSKPDQDGVNLCEEPYN